MLAALPVRRNDLDVSVTFNGTYMGENEKMSQSGSVSLFNFKVRAFVYNRESKEKEWVNRYIDVKAFDKLADRIRAMDKGKVCFVRGTVEEVRAYISNKTSEAVGVLSILADNIVPVPKEFEQTNDAAEEETVVAEEKSGHRAPPPRKAPSAKVEV